MSVLLISTHNYFINNSITILQEALAMLLEYPANSAKLSNTSPMPRGFWQQDLFVKKAFGEN